MYAKMTVSPLALASFRALSEFLTVSRCDSLFKTSAAPNLSQSASQEAHRQTTPMRSLHHQRNHRGRERGRGNRRRSGFGLVSCRPCFGLRLAGLSAQAHETLADQRVPCLPAQLDVKEGATTRVLCQRVVEQWSPQVLFAAFPSPHRELIDGLEVTERHSFDGSWELLRARPGSIFILRRQAA